MKCPRHNDREVPGFIICRCIVDGGLPVEHVILPEGKGLEPPDLGEILCGGRKHDDVDLLMLICYDCAVEAGYVPARPS